MKGGRGGRERKKREGNWRGTKAQDSSEDGQHPSCSRGWESGVFGKLSRTFRVHIDTGVQWVKAQLATQELAVSRDIPGRRNKL